MGFGWPWALFALTVVPMLSIVRWWLNRRRRRAALVVSDLSLIRAALPGRTAWRRRVPTALFLAGLLVLAAGFARPHARMAVPSNETSILLAIDVSGSMCSTDVDPNRLAVAGDAARRFVERQDRRARIGLIAFSGIAGLLVSPTTDRKTLIRAIDGLKTGRGTAIGRAILTAIDAIAESNPDVPATGVDLSEGVPAGAGDYQPDAIVVLTDGSNTTGVDPVTAAEQAAARRVRVFTIGFGGTEPAPMVCTPDQVSGDFAPSGRGYWSGGRAQEVDEKALTEVAEVTGGRYFRAADADQLGGVLADLPSELGVHREEVEVTVWFTLAAALLVLAGMALALWWNRPAGRPADRPGDRRSPRREHGG